MKVEDKQTQIKLESEVLRALLAHLNKRSDVQNIELMNLAGFCRNCLSKWYAKSASEHGIEMSKDEARAFIYGMDYGEWKRQFQTDATPEQKQTFKAVMADPDLTS